MLLKRLPNLPQELIALLPGLEKVSITSTDHLLASAPIALKSLTEDVPPYLIDHLVQVSLRAIAPQASSAETYQSRSRVAWQGFGLEGLDGLIPEQGYGGWQGSGVIELAGARSSGKTLFALHLALRHLIADELATCHWIDIDGSFAPNRARSILQLWEIQNAASVLDRISVHLCFSLERDMPVILDTISTSLEDEHAGSEKPAVIVLEPITDLFKNVLNNTSSQGHAMMVTLLEDLSELTQTYSLMTLQKLLNTTVSSLPTNPSSVFSTTSTKPALGASMTFFTDISLLLQDSAKVFPMDEGERDRARGKEGGMRGVVEVLKNRMGPPGVWAMFETDGIRLLDVVADLKV